MKNIVYLFALCISLFCIPAFAQGVPENLNQAASVTPPAITSAAIPSATPPTITWPEVADKSISNTLEFIKSNSIIIGNVIKDVAPEVWRILILQQYVKGCQNVFTAVLIFIAALISWKISYKITDRYSANDYDNEHRYKSEDPRLMVNIICAIIAVIAFVAIILATTSSIGYFINPEFYALKDLFDIIRGK